MRQDQDPTSFQWGNFDATPADVASNISNQRPSGLVVSISRVAELSACVPMCDFSYPIEAAFGGHKRRWDCVRIGIAMKSE